MTVSMNLANIANAISALSVSGVTVKDTDEIVGTWQSLPNVLYPQPDGWLTNFSIEYVAYPQGANAKLDISYTLNYRFLGVAIGDSSTFPVAYTALITKLILIVNAIIGMDAPYAGSVEMILGSVEVGPRTDPAGNDYFGADFALNITEMQNL